MRAALVLAMLAASLAAMSQIVWQKSFAASIKQSAGKKPIFVDFFAEWCGPCKMLEREVFPDPRVKALLQGAVCLRIDVDQNEADARRFKVSSIPRLLLLTPDGKGSLWDAVGYRDADTFVEELSEAMKVKAPVKGTVSAAPGAPASPALAKVQAALSDGSFSRLKAADPASVKEGLRLLVESLGAFNEADFKEAASLVAKAGRDALPALIEGMGHKVLAVRVGSYKVVRGMLSKDELKGLTYNPWAASPKRASQLAAWQRLVRTG